MNSWDELYALALMLHNGKHYNMQAWQVTYNDELLSINHIETNIAHLQTRDKKIFLISKALFVFNLYKFTGNMKQEKLFFYKKIELKKTFSRFM